MESLESTTKPCIKCNNNTALSDTNFICSDCFASAKTAENLEIKKKNKWGIYAEETFNVPGRYVPLESSNLFKDNQKIYLAMYNDCVATRPAIINLKGDPLSGKTSMAVLLMKSIFKADMVSCCYYFSLLNAYKYDKKVLSTMLTETEFLCLDNIGCSEEDANLIYSVLNRRVSQQLPTILVYDNGYKPESVYMKTPANLYIRALLTKYRLWATKYDEAGGSL